MDIGIDCLSFYTPSTYLLLSDLAHARGEAPEKYAVGIGQEKMAVCMSHEDTVTMAIKAVAKIEDQIDSNALDLILFCTESAVDQAKSAGMYVQEYFGFSNHCRVLELKQACYASTAALQLARSHIALHPDAQVLVIASDIARYPLASAAEPTQGAGAVAFIVKKDPRLATVSPQSGFWSEHVDDFWRPNDSKEAFVDGALSTRTYLSLLEKSWSHYQAKSGLEFADLKTVCYHLPCTKLGLKAHTKLSRLNGEHVCESTFDANLLYGRQVGNCYTASLYISLLSWLENTRQDLSGTHVGMYSYGSGATAEFFSLTIQNTYKDVTRNHSLMLENRRRISVGDYESLRQSNAPRPPEYNTDTLVRFCGTENHKRIYEDLRFTDDCKVAV